MEGLIVYKTVVLLLAIVTTILAFLDFSSRIVEAICNAIKESDWYFNFTHSLKWFIISSIFWTAFYVLNNI